MYWFQGYDTFKLLNFALLQLWRTDSAIKFNGDIIKFYNFFVYSFA